MSRWYHREGSKRTGFRYIDDEGRAVREKRVLARIDSLRIPPAWRDVHVAHSAASAIQAWGFDARGRKQYRYHQRAVERGELRKYHRVRRLAKDLPRIRRGLRADAASPELGREAVSAIVLRLIGETFCRIGSERYARENGTFGVTTIRKSHVETRAGAVEFSYRGKSRRPQRQVVATPELVRLICRLRRVPGRRLFRYRDERGWRDLTARDINDYLRNRIGEGYSAKDFRTWGGTLRAAVVLAELGPPRSPTEAKRNVAIAMRLVGSELGNTAAVCRRSYVHPIVIARYLDEGEVIRLASSRRRSGEAHLHSADERALIAFLDRHFPERRSRHRASGHSRARTDRR